MMTNDFVPPARMASLIGQGRISTRCSHVVYFIILSFVFLAWEVIHSIEGHNLQCILR